MKIDCFKAYDVRGRVPDQINEDVAYRIGRAFVQFLGAKSVVVGHDIRLSSPQLSAALVRGLCEQGADVIDIGLCGTEEIYFATFHLGVDGGIAVTASHNPMDYNGMKFVREGSRPISGDTGLNEIQSLAEGGVFAAPSRQGSYQLQDTRPAYIEHLLTYVDRTALKPLKLVMNAGNGGAGLVVDQIEKHLPFDIIKVHHNPDGTFPNGVPNPLLEENRAPTIDALKKSGADLGIAWDGDFDRCFFFDENGGFVEGYYLVGLLAEAFLVKNKGAAIVHDPRLTWNTIAVCDEFGGRAVQSKTGHAFIKERMRKEDAVYGGEMSAHHYFRDFAYCDSGMIPWLLVAELVCRSGKTLSQLVHERMQAYPVSGEINRHIEDPKAAIAKVRNHYLAEAISEDNTDGLSLEFADWRFNVRMSNTEPVVRLNVETRANTALMLQRRDELLALLDG
ncbi:MAG TPA: phosphomannomutase [Pseudomonadales bacterium]|nr:phosphomannomutase [Pseudomonadales bacterium]